MATENRFKYAIAVGTLMDAINGQLKKDQRDPLVWLPAVKQAAQALQVAADLCLKTSASGRLTRKEILLLKAIDHLRNTKAFDSKDPGQNDAPEIMASIGIWK